MVNAIFSVEASRRVSFEGCGRAGDRDRSRRVAAVNITVRTFEGGSGPAKSISFVS